MPMASDSRIRASDADRDRTAALLREHHAAGRLTAEEFSERLDKAYAAKTLGELDELLADLPGIDLYQLPDASLDRTRRGLPPLPWMMAPGSVGRFPPAWRAAWGSWFSVSLIAFLVWLLTGHPGNLWFLWVAGPFALVLLGRWISGEEPRRRRRRRGY
jgi:uncharacterized protein DUF1707